MIVPISADAVQRFSEVEHPTKWDVASGVAKRFPEIATKLPAKRKPWQSEDDRLGVFIALAGAVTGWRSVNTKR